MSWQGRTVLAVSCLFVGLTTAAGGENEIFIYGPIIAEGQGTEIQAGAMSLRFPAKFPPADEVLAGLPKANGRSRPTGVRGELISFNLEPWRFYPLVGPARMIESRFKCTVKRAKPNEPEDVIILVYRQLMLKGPDK